MNVVDIVTNLFPTICRLFQWLSKRKPTPGILLIVEDDAVDAELLQEKVAKAGWKSEVATTAQMAEGLVRHMHYPVIFIDMRLPGMPGEALMRIISKDAPNTKVVVVCGEPHDLSKIPPGTFTMFIRKPASLESIETLFHTIKILHTKDENN